MASARDGSQEALDALFARCAGKLLALIRVRIGSLRSRLESRDVLQNTFMKALRSLDQFDGEDSASLQAWLASIANNELRDLADRHHAQRRSVVREAPLSAARGVEASVVSLVSQVTLSERSQRLEKILFELPADHREVILLRSLEELEFPRIAERMARSADACRMLYARAMTELTLRMTR